MRRFAFTIGLLLSFALSAAAHYVGAPLFGPTAQFIISAVAIIFVAGFLGQATESVAHYAGERLGGFLNATFGNAAELIIAIFLVRDGLFEVVKASITGSIIGNMLLVLGLSVLLGGLKFKEQRFNLKLAGHNASLMTLAVIALFIPAAFSRSLTTREVAGVSIVVSILLIAAYLLWLYFSMVSHKKELEGGADREPEKPEEPKWPKGRSILYLLLATAMVAFESEWIVHTLEDFSRRFGLSELFVGAFLVAIVGNAAEHSAAVMLALKNRIGASVEIAIGSSLQIALFVAPALVLLSMLFGSTMDIVFTTHELLAIGVAALIAISISRDGSTNWYEGVLLLVVYAILGLVFFLV
ncbi:calcium/proton exchanger [Paenibacillus ginsengihumi]|uniref:calcium/proton exchanger n=1 Tax=Paenibacillus ginsengihumi TaxID=431596 RepID=UPI0003722511|nr:calcium/proton exchanger [Paenibacillus ginsengihumi]